MKRYSEIYALKDPRSGQVRYVGASRWSGRSRYGSHIQSSYGTPKIPTGIWIAELRREGLKPELVILQRVSQERDNAVEMRWIRKFRAQGADLLNRTGYLPGQERPKRGPVPNVLLAHPPAPGGEGE